ncbi:MAG: DUF3781 domain-containing protein [Anaeroplasma bactoclasticum]|nr:DUF3781 domain-containing protein [Anaeroplasma bactoclasticum]
MDKEILIANIDKLHTTNMGLERIIIHLQLHTQDAVEYCKNLILDERCQIYRKGKNFYCEINHIQITIHASSYTIITAHALK